MRNRRHRQEEGGLWLTRAMVPAHACLFIVGAVLLNGLVFPLGLIALAVAMPSLARTCLASTAGQRVSIAAFVGLTVLWPTQPTTTVHLVPGDSLWQQWNEDRRPSGMHETSLVAGYPFRGIEGSTAGGFPGHLPLNQGLLVLLANFLIFAAAAGILAALIPRRMLIWVQGVTWISAVITSLQGVGWLVGITD